ncbi:hypothetical protein [Aeromicrobium duanguangcaii]|uniref:RAMA domain-containing protein n=1 Tax=Aeromicrobium duanguangcaii TaxID=2968086 RepID=A0ABY5KKD6_9ACTN|nr:hypothetical protein [Aeromicrobium duanguangcaii]MCD9152968.1 hypothetical protein [Aeromicrobium duanguangcaii]UUI69926.1 hypothetical protein NP095_07480 [Aeromicrobium duanguangcaii]
MTHGAGSVNGEGIFQISPGGELLSLEVTPYEAEDVLQALLETHPDLLAGAQMTPEVPRRWALVKREQGVPDRDDSGSRWSVDHLFVDQDAVPTLVEVKRSTDTRIRREVVGQMLDYAANGVRYWPAESLQLAFEATQSALGNSPRGTLASLCDDGDVSAEGFFARVGDNLRAGRIRMVFVADVIPDELMRIVEFLNEQMNPAEVFAVQVKRFRAQGHEDSVIVPAVYGRTAAASTKNPQRRMRDRATAVDASRPETIRLIELITGFAPAAGLTVRETPGGAVLETSERETVANVYLDPYDSLDIPLERWRARGLVDQAESLHASLNGLTDKALTAKIPSLPSRDVVAHWSQVRSVLQRIADLHRSIP